jgi:hypothetical protein
MKPSPTPSDVISGKISTCMKQNVCSKIIPAYIQCPRKHVILQKFFISFVELPPNPSAPVRPHNKVSARRYINIFVVANLFVKLIFGTIIIITQKFTCTCTWNCGQGTDKIFTNLV